MLEQGATLVLFSNGAVAGARPTSRSTGWRTSPARCWRPRRAGGRGVGGAGGGIAEGCASRRAGRRRGRPRGPPRATSVEPLRLELKPCRRPSRCAASARQLARRVGMGEQDRVGVMVAVGEACANAAEHAYRGAEPGPMAVSADVDVDGVLTVSVRDEGTWRPRTAIRATGARPDHAPARRHGRPRRGGPGDHGHLRLRLRRVPRGDRPGQRPSGAHVTVDRRARPVVVASGAVDEAVPSSCASGCWRPATAAPAGWSSTSPTSSCSAAPRSRVVLAIARIARDEAGGWSSTPPRAASPGTCCRSAAWRPGRPALTAARARQPRRAPRPGCRRRPVPIPQP